MNPSTEMVSVTSDDTGITLSVEKARDMLAQARTVDEVKDVRDVAVAMRAYSRERTAGMQIEIDAGEIICRADIRLGELSRELPKAPNDGSRGGGHLASPHRGPAKQEALADAGITKQRASENEQMASVPTNVFEAHIAEQRKAGKAPTTKGVLALVRKAKTTPKRKPPHKIPTPRSRSDDAPFVELEPMATAKTVEVSKNQQNLVRLALDHFASRVHGLTDEGRALLFAELRRRYPRDFEGRESVTT